MASLETGDFKKIPIKMSFKAKIGEPLGLSIEDDENKVMISGDIVILQRQNLYPKALSLNS